MSELLVVDHVSKTFHSKKYEDVRAVSDVSFSIAEGESISIVGESGCGKSTLAKLITCMEMPDSGHIVFEGTNLTACRGRQLREKRRRIQMVFQQPQAAISPRMHIGTFLRVPLDNFGIVPKQNVNSEIDRLLEMVQLPKSYRDKYPHEVSGGELQRIVIARAMAARPKLIICDEATSALDAAIQKDMIELLNDLKKESGVSYLFITHDLSLVNKISDRVMVMYQGKVVENLDSRHLLDGAQNSYTCFLLSSVLTLKTNPKRKIEIREYV